MTPCPNCLRPTCKAYTLRTPSGPERADCNSVAVVRLHGEVADLKAKLQEREARLARITDLLMTAKKSISRDRLERIFKAP